MKQILLATAFAALLFGCGGSSESPAQKHGNPETVAPGKTSDGAVAKTEEVKPPKTEEVKPPKTEVSAPPKTEGDTPKPDPKDPCNCCSCCEDKK